MSLRSDLLSLLTLFFIAARATTPAVIWAIRSESQLFADADKARVRRLVAAFADWQQGWVAHADGWMGRRLWGVFNATRAFDAIVEARVLTNTDAWYANTPSP